MYLYICYDGAHYDDMCVCHVYHYMCCGVVMLCAAIVC